PVEGEYLPYQINYINRVPDGNLLPILRVNGAATANFLLGLPAEKIDHRYAEGKWSIKEVLQHLIDTERIMCYRALRFGRNDKIELPGFEEKDYVANANTAERDFGEMIDEYVIVRNGSICMIKSFNDEILSRSGIANNGRCTVNAIAYVIAGHELHHAAIIKERYL
ncbi:MAG: DinB family protein, partial [Chitinophagales bacterium]|nr:DinB family protein [Chitinophagales bacterium]